MPPKKKPYSELSKSGKYFRDNPKARKKKDEISKKVNARPEQRKKRVELITENRKRDKANGGKSHRKGKDLGHQKDGSLRYESVKRNRGKRGEGNRKKK